MRVRKSIEELQIAYERGDKKPLEALMRAWKGIQELSTDDFNSFFLIGGYHGEPFRGAGWGNSGFWGGYCNHGNVLFPVWHRVYLYRIENALRSIPDCEEVTLPFWDETSVTSKNNGIPWALTIETFELEVPSRIRDCGNGMSTVAQALQRYFRFAQRFTSSQSNDGSGDAAPFFFFHRAAGFLRERLSRLC